MGAKTARNDPYQLVTDAIITHLKRGVIPWRCPWNRAIGRPRNFHSRREYRGINALLLGLQEVASPWWMTFRQVREQGGKIRRGEHGTSIMKWGKAEKTAENGDGTADQKLSYFLGSYRVFNATQIEGIEFPQTEDWPRLEPDQCFARAEQILAQIPNQPSISQGRGNRVGYSVTADAIRMPPFNQFKFGEDYHIALFPALIRATGHPSRLNRQGATKQRREVNEPEVDQEDLIAEIGAAFLAMEVDIPCVESGEPTEHVQAWLKTLSNPEHRRWVVLSANQAGRAVEFILGRIKEGGEDPSSVSQNSGQEGEKHLDHQPPVEQRKRRKTRKASLPSEKC